MASSGGLEDVVIGARGDGRVGVGTSKVGDLGFDCVVGGRRSRGGGVLGFYLS